jgi:hypothetical protein
MSNELLYQIHDDGKIFRYSGSPFWEPLDQNPLTKSIAVGNRDIYQIHKNGDIYKYIGNPNWQPLDDNDASKAIVADGDRLYQIHQNGFVYRYNGGGFRDWKEVDGSSTAKAIAAGGGHLYKIDHSNHIRRFEGPNDWKIIDDNPATRGIMCIDGTLVQIHADGRMFRRNNGDWHPVPQQLLLNQNWDICGPALANHANSSVLAMSSMEYIESFGLMAAFGSTVGICMAAVPDPIGLAKFRCAMAVMGSLAAYAREIVETWKRLREATSSGGGDGSGGGRADVGPHGPLDDYGGGGEPRTRIVDLSGNFIRPDESLLDLSDDQIDQDQNDYIKYLESKILRRNKFLIEILSEIPPP